MAAYVGLDPARDITWLTRLPAEAKALLAEGQIDAYLASPPDSLELRARKIGHVVVNSAMDRPWSQYFCCLLVGGSAFVNRYPVVSKSVVRAYVRAADICANEPERVARYLVDKKLEPRYDIGLEVLKQLPYNRWRDASPADTIRFHALRLHEVGMIETAPNKLVARSTDWRFIEEVRRELKA
jgi:NitT/TauT family transport system substrate-binding protein